MVKFNYDLKMEYKNMIETKSALLRKSILDIPKGEHFTLRGLAEKHELSKTLVSFELSNFIDMGQVEKIARYTFKKVGDPIKNKNKLFEILARKGLTSNQGYAESVRNYILKLKSERLFTQSQVYEATCVSRGIVSYETRRLEFLGFVVKEDAGLYKRTNKIYTKDDIDFSTRKCKLKFFNHVSAREPKRINMEEAGFVNEDEQEQVTIRNEDEITITGTPDAIIKFVRRLITDGTEGKKRINTKTKRS